VENPQENEQQNVIRLAEYRSKRRRREPRVAVLQDWGPQYYCLRCDGDDFKLYASGIVHCAHCGSLMRNLLVGGSKSEEPSQ
jgi:ribosomal protein L37AE/L43A